MVSRIFFAILGLLFSLYVIRNTTKNKIIERESFVWLLSIVFVVLLGVFPEILDWTAVKLNISYGPSLLFFLSILILAILLFRQTMDSAKHQHKIDELGHRVALLEEEISNLNRKINEPS